MYDIAFRKLALRMSLTWIGISYMVSKTYLRKTVFMSFSASTASASR